MKKFQNTINKFLGVLGLGLFLLIWQGLSMSSLIPSYMLPGPIEVFNALMGDFYLLLSHARVTLTEAILGLGIGLLIGFITALIMDYFDIFYKMTFPLLIISQTIPTIAIAPLLVLWFGYDMSAKVVLIVIATFFPITIGLLDGFKSIDPDILKLFKSMGASRLQTLIYAKLPHVKPYFFAGLRISASYCIVGGVIAEWLGGFQGLGVYMTRVRKSYSFDKMFASIILISLLSLILIKLVDYIQKLSMPYLNNKGE
ncbi:MAG: ABC transporter permease [Anaerococcus sp.]|nr:ABC transporter permease [Anaerococcus sp.]